MLGRVIGKPQVGRITACQVGLGHVVLQVQALSKLQQLLGVHLLDLVGGVAPFHL